MTKPLDRSEAVNLARNVLDGVPGWFTLTATGIRHLSEAVLAMDAELTRLYAHLPEVAGIVEELAAIADAVCDLQQHKRRADSDPVITFDDAKLTLGTLRKARAIRDSSKPQKDETK